MTDDRKGDWMMTFTGRKFWPLDPRADEVCLDDVATALAHQGRYNGQGRHFYSIAPARRPAGRLVRRSGSGKTCKSVEDPLDTITVKDRLGLICPVTNSGGGPIARDVEAPLPTLTTAKGGHLLFITASFGERDDQLPRVHDLELPMPTIAAQGSVRLAEA